MKKVCILMTLLISMLMLSPGIGNGKEYIQIRCQLFRILSSLSGDTSLEEYVWPEQTTPDPELKKTLTILTKADLRLDTDRLIVNDKGWFWNGKKLGFDSSSTLIIPESRMNLVSSPSILVKDGDFASIVISSDQSIEYMEKRDDGLFELKKVPERTGLEIELSVNKEAGDKIRIRDLKFLLKSIEKREQIPGLTLPVGRPILKTRTFELDLRITEGKDYGFILHPGDGQGVLIIRFGTEIVKEKNISATQNTERGEGQ